MTAKIFKKRVMKPIGDLLLGKITSKKLSVFIVATFGLFFDKLDGDNFTLIAMVYIGGLTFINFLKHQKNKTAHYNPYNTEGDDT